MFSRSLCNFGLVVKLCSQLLLDWPEKALACTRVKAHLVVILCPVHAQKSLGCTRAHLVLILGTQAANSVNLIAQGIDPTDPSLVSDELILTTSFEVITDCVVQAGSLTAFRVYRWADAQQYKR